MSDGVQYRPSRNGKRGSHTAGDVGGGLYSGRSSGGVSSSGSRPHTSQSGTRLPNLTHFPGQANSSNNNAYASSFASTPGLNSRTSVSRSSGPPSMVAEWKHDEGLGEWYKNVQNRKKSHKVKAYKQAMKDAHWVLERRARQMKEIRERQKLEEAEAARNAQAEYAHQAMQHSRMSISQLKPDTTPGGKKEGSAGPKSAAGMAHAAGKSLMSTAAMEKYCSLGNPVTGANSPHHMQSHLEWRAVTPESSSKDRTKDVTVWIKPGVFVVKNVLMAPGNIFT